MQWINNKVEMLWTKNLVFSFGFWLQFIQRIDHKSQNRYIWVVVILKHYNQTASMINTLPHTRFPYLLTYLTYVLPIPVYVSF